MPLLTSTDDCLFIRHSIGISLELHLQLGHIFLPRLDCHCASFELRHAKHSLSSEQSGPGMLPMHLQTQYGTYYILALHAGDPWASRQRTRHHVIAICPSTGKQHVQTYLHFGCLDSLFSGQQLSRDAL